MYLRGFKIIVFINFPKIPPRPGQVGSAGGVEGIDPSAVSSRSVAHTSLYTGLAPVKPGAGGDSCVTEVLGVALTLASVLQPDSRGRLPEREHLSQALGRGPPPPGCGPEEGEMECGVGCVVEPDPVLSRQQTPEKKSHCHLSRAV